MSRPVWIDFPEAWYHVLNRGRRREDIFLSTRDYELVLGNLEYAAGLFNVRVAACCLMTNHYHLMVQIPEGNLSRFMRPVDGVYTQRFNKAHRLDGHLQMSNARSDPWLSYLKRDFKRTRDDLTSSLISRLVNKRNFKRLS